MGKTWTRDGGSQVSQPTARLAKHQHFPPPKRKANVWTRDSSAAGPSNSTAPTRGPGDASAENEREAKRRRLAAKGRLLPGDDLPETDARGPDVGSGPLSDAQPQESSAALARAASAAAKEAARKEALLQETEALRRRIAEEESRLAAAKAAAQKLEAQAAAALKAKQEQLNLRKSRLDAGFAEAFKATRELAASQKAPKVASASEAEVRRVLAAKSDLEVLQLKPGADRSSVKKKYRAMTLALHPDKCKVESATDAFQRLVVAYQSVLKYAR